MSLDLSHPTSRTQARHGGDATFLLRVVDLTHDLNNAVLAIKVYSALLRPALPAMESLADLDEIAGAAERAASLTRELQRLAKHELGDDREEAG
ncbi:MAG: hypothetical protein KGL94_02485 [Acidobacteriota bacterium]|nr:hypothetical protein [Acidobacteriota bacterium]